MRLARLVLFVTYAEPLVTAFSPAELTIPLEDFYEQAKKPGSLLILDFFEAASLEMRDIGPALEARNAEREEEERHMAMLYFWSLSQLRLLQPRGLLAMPNPAPISADNIVLVLEQVADAPAYKHQTITAIAEDGRVIHMSDGNCTKPENLN